MPHGARARRCRYRNRPSLRRRAARPSFAGGGGVPRTRPVLRRYRHERRRARHEERNRATPSERRATSADVFVTVQDMSAAPDRRRMSVVQVLPALEMGGVERGTLEVARRLVAEGHRSTVISAGGRLVEQLEHEGSTHLAWDVGAKRLSTLRWIPRLRRFLRDERPALVTTVHGFYTPGRYSSVMVRGERIIAISESVRAHILEHYPWVDAARIRVIHRGVDPAAYPHGYHPPTDWLATWRAQHPELQGQYVLTLPARLSRWKGQEDFIASGAALRAQGVPAHGLLVGGTHPRKRHYEAELRAQIAAQDMGRHITLLGHRSDLREIMAVSDVVLSLSRDPEAFGRVSLEALSLGRPVIAYAHGGVGEQLAVILPQGAVPVGEREQVVARLREWRRAPPAVPVGQPCALPAPPAPRLHGRRGNRYVQGVIRALRDLSPAYIEIHNRPVYVAALRKAFPHTPIALYIHNDPHSIRGIRASDDRARCIEQVAAVICVSDFIRRRMREGIETHRDMDKLRVVLHGVDTSALLPSAQKRARRAQAAIAVIPSQWDDPCPRSVIEALASGCATIASPCGGIPELVTDAGVLVQGGDPAVWAEALLRFAEDEMVRADYQRAARSRAVQGLDIRHTAARLDAIRNELMHALSGANS